MRAMAEQRVHREQHREDGHRRGDPAVESRPGFLGSLAHEFLGFRHRLLLWFGARSRFLALAHRFFEAPDRLSEALAELRQPFGSEDDQRDERDDDQMQRLKQPICHDLFSSPFYFLLSTFHFPNASSHTTAHRYRLHIPEQKSA